MSFEWQDKKDGVDDILADDINRIAHAIGSGLTTIGEIAPKVEQHEKDIANLNKPAGYEEGVPISLLGITTAENPEAATITENVLSSTTTQTFTINYQGNADIELSSTGSATLYVDGVLIFRISSATPGAWAGEVKETLSIRLQSGRTATFTKFIGDKYNNGFMTGEQAKKLENTPTASEVNNMINEAFGTVEAVFDEVHEYAESLGGEEV